MYTHIMVPVDLAEKDRWQHAIDIACDLAQHYRARLTLVSVSGGLQGRVSHSDQEYARQLEEHAAHIAARHDIAVGSHTVSTPDPSVEVDHALRQLIEVLRADLVVMASHQPGWMEYLVDSHGGRMARHAPVSVFLVRDPAALD